MRLRIRAERAQRREATAREVLTAAERAEHLDDLDAAVLAAEQVERDTAGDFAAAMEEEASYLTRAIEAAAWGALAAERIRAALAARTAAKADADAARAARLSLPRRSPSRGAHRDGVRGRRLPQRGRTRSTLPAPRRRRVHPPRCPGCGARGPHRPRAPRGGSSSADSPAMPEGAATVFCEMAGYDPRPPQQIAADHGRCALPEDRESVQRRWCGILEGADGNAMRPLRVLSGKRPEVGLSDALAALLANPLPAAVEVLERLNAARAEEAAPARMARADRARLEGLRAAKRTPRSRGAPQAPTAAARWLSVEPVPTAPGIRSRPGHDHARTSPRPYS